MDFEDVAAIVDGVPHMPKPHGRELYDHVVQYRLQHVLELGTSHGVSACYLGAAVDELGTGKVVTIDRKSAADLEPNIFDLKERTGLGKRIEPLLAERTFTWELKRFLERPDPPLFDFVFLDAGHTWDSTGFAFFLVDRMLRAGGWLLFDDLNWTVASRPYWREKSWARSLPQEEREARQVGAVFDTLVGGDPRYTTNRDGRWGGRFGWAQKQI
jgi:predicted O-methyltransferase YrrM